MSITVNITRRRLSLDRVIRAVMSPDVGGVVVFVGTVRSRSGSRRITSLLLEAAEDLARSDIERVAKAAKRRFNVAHIAVSHRVGTLGLGDVIVIIAVGATHRKDAFAACRFIIDELKKSTPIWKKELGPGWERWVKGEQ